MTLKRGDQAPDFTLYSDSIKPWLLADALSHGRVVLLFFPGAFTSVCTTELNTVNNDLSRFTEGGAQLVGISTDHPAVLAEFRRVNDLAFPLLSDHEAEVAEAYGARYAPGEHRLGYSRVAKRASFVIEPDGTLAYADVQANSRDLPDFDAIAAAVRS
jgi:glutaredoxin-dependent peroxiredoxin